MKRLKVKLISVILGISTLSLLGGCNQKNDPGTALRDSLTFYASFDEGFEADFAKGDSKLYKAPSWDQRGELELLEEGDNSLQIDEGEGIRGDALWMDIESNPVFFYKAKDNISYNKEDWSGTVSFWLRLSPDEDLRDGYSDPIQITSRAWNDGALFVDFTDKDPRIFRYAIIPDREVWDPEERNWNEVPPGERPMLNVPNHPFSKDKWIHVAFSFSSFNTGLPNGNVDGYLNGEYVGSLSGHEKTFTWDPEKVAIWLGFNYRGYFDELAIFNRKLDAEEINQLYKLKAIGDINDTP